MCSRALTLREELKKEKKGFSYPYFPSFLPILGKVTIAAKKNKKTTMNTMTKAPQIGVTKPHMSK